MRFKIRSKDFILLVLIVLLAAPAMAREVTIAFTGDLAGEIFPCG